ncbi:MAG: flippase [Candidatus Magasanikbacteria bacterium]|nr:flippase [Candidatus Magasanikbacteria bacterium]
MTYSITQNTVYLTVASVLQKAISFVYFTIVARIIGVENTGQYFFALAFASVFAVVADFGMGPILTREMARTPERSERYVNNLLLSKLLFGAVAFIFIIGFANLLNYGSALKLLIYMAGVTMFFDNLQTVFYSTFRAHKNLKVEAVGLVVSQFLTLCFGTVALLSRAPLVYLIASYTAASLIMVCYGAYMVKTRLHLKLNFEFDWSILRFFLKYSWAFAAAAILSRLYAYTDSIFISKILPPAHLGWWSVPYKIAFAWQFIPVAVATSLYPVFSRHFKDVEKIRETFIKAWRYLFMVVFPLALGIIAVARPLVLKLYGAEFEPSIIVLQVLMLSLIFGFLSFISGAVLNASNRQNTQTVLMGVALIVNVILNLLLLPRYGLVGAAWAALATNIILTVAGFMMCDRFLKFSYLAIFKLALRYLIPAVIMSVSTAKLIPVVTIFPAILISILLYGLLILITRGVLFSELKELYQRFT